MTMLDKMCSSIANGAVVLKTGVWSGKDQLGSSLIVVIWP